MQAGSTPTSTDSALLAELALSRGDLVQEWGYDDDVDFTFRDALEDALGDLGEEAARLGVALYLEPLNRYEDHMVNNFAVSDVTLKPSGPVAVTTQA